MPFMNGINMVKFSCMPCFLHWATFSLTIIFCILFSFSLLNINETWQCAKEELAFYGAYNAWFWY